LPLAASPAVVATAIFLYVVSGQVLDTRDPLSSSMSWHVYFQMVAFLLALAVAIGTGLLLGLTAAFHAMRAAIPGMKAKKWGRIISTASAHSLVASPFKAAYVTAKHGLAGLTKTAALEVATFGITVNCISPGYVWTPLVAKQIPDTMKARNMTEEQVKNDVLLAAQPTKQFVTVEQVAALALYLTSDVAASITGANLSIDGGWTAQ